PPSARGVRADYDRCDGLRRGVGEPAPGAAARAPGRCPPGGPGRRAGSDAAPAGAVHNARKSAKSNPGETTQLTNVSTVADAVARCQVPGGTNACGHWPAR